MLSTGDEDAMPSHGAVPKTSSEITTPDHDAGGPPAKDTAT